MSTFNQTSKPHAPALIPIHQPSSSRESKWKDAPVKAALRSPFFHPSNPRISTLQTPRGTARPSIVINDVTVKDLEKKSSLLGAYANLCNATIGAGIVCLPYAIKEAGLVSGVIMIILCAIMTEYSLRQVITTGKQANVNSYETLMEATFGRPGFIYLSLNMFFLSYGAMLAYLTIIKDVLPILFGVAPDDEDMKRFIMMLSSLMIILPLSMQRDMADLEKTSRLNVILNVILVGIIAIYSPVTESVIKEGGFFQVFRQEMVFDVQRFFVGFGVASFAFVCQDSSFIIAGSFDNPTKSRWKKVTQATMLTCCTLELIVGICGYLAYQENTLGNVLNNMEIHSQAGLVSRAILATTMFFAYPINLYIARHACVVLCFKGISAHQGDDHTVLSRNDRRVILTWILYIASLIPALMNIDTGLILSATGAVAASSLAYIGPGMTFIAVYHAEFSELIKLRWQSSSKYLWRYPCVSGDENDQIISFGIITWYFFLMPLWSTIAMFGKTNMSVYIQKEDSLSPGLLKPKRLTVIPPATKNNNVANGNQNAIQLPRCPSNPAMKRMPSDEDTFLIHPKPLMVSYGTTTTSPNTAFKMVTTRCTRISAVEIEEELKVESPRWMQFYIAMIYTIVGVGAMSLGIVSILSN